MLDKQAVLGLIGQQGNSDLLQQAEEELPAQVDPQQHGELLQRFGVDPQQALDQVGGAAGVAPSGGAESGL